MPETDGYISHYTRAQAIEDGALIDVTTLAREAGILYNTVISAGGTEAIRTLSGGRAGGTRFYWPLMGYAKYFPCGG